MRLIGYECRKLTKQLHIWLFTGLLLTGNLFMLYASQRSTPAYFFIFQQKDSYAAFCQGDKDADAMGFYQQELDAQEGYLASYRQFITEMESRAAKMRETVFYRDENSYVFRNLQKTCEVFSAFADTAVTADNCFGLRAFAEYDYGILFLLIFLGLVTWYVLFYERNRNLLLLLKGCRQGHCPLAFAKLITLLLSGAFYVLILDEPTAGLDPAERIRIRNFISENAKNKIVLLATHVVSDVEYISKEILILRQGKMVRKGPPRELLAELDHKVFEALVTPEEEPYYQQGGYKIANVSLTEDKVCLRIVSDKIPAVGEVHSIRPCLEDVYLYWAE